MSENDHMSSIFQSVRTSLTKSLTMRPRRLKPSWYIGYSTSLVRRALDTLAPFSSGLLWARQGTAMNKQIVCNLATINMSKETFSECYAFHQQKLSASKVLRINTRNIVNWLKSGELLKSGAGNLKVANVSSPRRY